MANLIPEKPLDISNFDELIASYNKETSKESKTENLKKINDTVHKLLEEKKSPELADKLKLILKTVKVQTNDIDIWKEIMGEIEKVSPSISKAKFEDIPDELFYYLIIEELAKEDIGELAKTNKRFHTLLSKPESLAHFLDKFSSQIPFEKRFPLAIRCGSSLYKLDLSNCKVNDEHLKELKEKCPKLESLNLSNTGIKSLDHLPEGLTHLDLNKNTDIGETEFNKLAKLSKLESLELENSHITSLEILPKRLKRLNLDSCRLIPSQEFNQLRSFPNLESLDLSATAISSLDPLLSLNLKELELAVCEKLSIAQPEFDKIAKFPQLKKLNLLGTKIKTLNMLSKNLIELNIGYNTIPSGEYEKLSSLQNLKKLELRMTNVSNLDGLPKNLREIDLQGCHDLPTEEVKKLADLPQLKVIHLQKRFKKEVEIIDLLRAHGKEVTFARV